MKIDPIPRIYSYTLFTDSWGILYVFLLFHFQDELDKIHPTFTSLLGESPIRGVTITGSILPFSIW